MGKILTVLFLGVLMAALDIAILGPAIPAIRGQFSLSEREVSWVFTAWVLANLVGVPIMSKLADRFGRKRMYLVVVSLFAAGATVVAAAPSFDVLLLGRSMQGFAVSGIFPVAGAFVGDTFPPERRGRAFGVLGSVFGVAFLIGPIFAGMMLMVGWRYLYLSFLPLAALILVLGVLLLPRSKPAAARPFDVIGLLCLGGFLLPLAYGISLLNTSDFAASLASPRVVLSFLAVAVFLPLFIRAERSAADPILRLDLFRNRQVRLACLLATGAGINEAAFIFFPTLAVLAYGVSTSEAAFMLIPLMLSVAIGSPIIGRILDVTGSRTVVVACNILLVAGMAGVAWAPGIRVVFYASSVAIGLGLAGLMGSALSYILIHEAARAERTVSQGLITLFISLGQLMTGAAVGAVAASSPDILTGYASAFLGIALVSVVMIAAAARLKGRTSEQSVVKAAG
ncbi:MAG: MFS transporter [Rhodothermales bacterium]